MKMRSSRVILVYTQPESLPGYKTPYQEEHLGLAYLAASLQKVGIPTSIVRSGEYASTNGLVAKILELRPLIVGFSPTFLTVNAVLSYAERLKKLKPAIHITIGGRQATFTAEEVLRSENSVDSIVRGEGEETIIDLTNRVIYGFDLEGCLGVWYKDNQGEIYRNSERPVVENLDRFPFPTRNLDPKSPYQWVQIVTSRGCVHHCSFCTTPDWLKLQSCQGRRRVRSAENVAEEIASLIKKGVTTIDFIDEDFIGTTREDKERVRKIAQLMIDNGLRIRWRGLWGAVSLHPKRDRDLLRFLKGSGLEQVGIGLEAGSDSALRAYNKPANSLLNKTACRFLLENNVFPKIGFIMFNPYSTFDELYENARFLGELGQACYSRYFLKSLEIHHGTKIRRHLEEDGLLLPHCYRSDDFQYRFLHPEVEPFALAMRELLAHSTTVRLNNSLYLSDIAVVRSVDSGKSLPDFDAYQAVRREIGEFDVQSFLRWVSLAQEGWSERAWTNLCSEYLGAIARFTAAIKRFNYESYID